jgi:(R)-amidase
VRVLIAQVTPTPGDLVGNVELAQTALGEQRSAELAVFPELFLCGYELPGAARLAISTHEEPLDRLRAAAAQHATAVVVGFMERTHDGSVANSAACIDADGRLAGVYRKTHLFGDAERRAFIPGDELVLVALAGRRVAPLICFDVEFPEPARALAKAGADLLVTISANMEPFGPDHELAARARALDNRRPHVYVNQAGRHRGLTFTGGSCAIGPDGRVLGGAGAGERLMEIDVPVGTPSAEDVDYLRHLRGDMPVRVCQPAARLEPIHPPVH